MLTLVMICELGRAALVLILGVCTASNVCDSVVAVVAGATLETIITSLAASDVTEVVVSAGEHHSNAEKVGAGVAGPIRDPDVGLF